MIERLLKDPGQSRLLLSVLSKEKALSILRYRLESLDTTNGRSTASEDPELPVRQRLGTVVRSEELISLRQTIISHINKVESCTTSFVFVFLPLLEQEEDNAEEETITKRRSVRLSSNWSSLKSFQNPLLTGKAVQSSEEDRVLSLEDFLEENIDRETGEVSELLLYLSSTIELFAAVSRGGAHDANRTILDHFFDFPAMSHLAIKTKPSLPPCCQAPVFDAILHVSLESTCHR